MSFNPWTFLFEIVNFVVLAYVLYRLLYRPLQEAIAERRQATARVQAEADAARQEAVTLQHQLQTAVAELGQQREEMIHQARAQAGLERQKILTEAEQVMQRRRDEARQTLDRERAEALENLQAEIIKEAVDLAERFLGQAVDSTLNRQLALRLVATLDALPVPERAQVRSQWQPRDGAVLETAAALAQDQLDQIAQSITTVLGQSPALVVQIKPALLGGLRLRLGGQVWDASLTGALEPARQRGREVVAHA